MYTLLYVDDDPNLLEIARFFLEDSGDFTLTTSLLATEALSLSGFASFDAIISDYEMPGIDGITFLKKVRAQYGDIPFILFTGKGREEVVIEAINNGADFYLQKGGDPIAQFAELAHKIKKAVERRRAERALKENERVLRINEERLVMAQALGHVGSWEYDIASNKIWGSAEGLHTFGYPPVAGDIPIVDIETCILERERVHQALVDLITKEQEYNLEYTINPADGAAPKVIHSIARLEKDADGNPLRVIGVIHDITERKRAEEEITFKNIILLTQQETAIDGILIVDDNGKILNYNQRFIRIWGITDAILASGMDEPLLQCVAGQIADPKSFLSRVRYLYEHNEERSFEELVLKDGRILERFSAPMLDESGKYYGRVWYFRDITGRRQSEDQLKESETRFHTLYSNMIEGAALHELTYNDRGEPEDYRILETNVAFEKHLGISRNKVIGKTSREAYGVTEPPYLDIYARVALFRTPEVFETYFPPLDRHFSISVYSPAKGRFATIFEDITERKQTEKELRKSERKYRLLTENTLDIIYSLDCSGKITHVSPHISRYGYTLEDLLTRDVSDVIYEEDLGKVMSDIQTTLTSGKSTQTLFRLKNAAGSPVWFEDNGAVLKDNSGAVVGITGVLRDITERKKAEEELHQQFVFMQNLIDAIPSPLFLKDRQGIYRGCNTAFEQFIGLSKDQIIGKSMYEIAPKNLADLYFEQDQALFNNPGTQTYETKVKFADGSLHDVIFNKATFFDNTGTTLNLVGIIQDITGRKQTEEALAESEQRFRQIFNVLPMGLWIADRNGKLVMGNPAGQKIWEAHPQVGQEEYGVFKAWRLPSHEPVLPDEWALGYAVNEGRVTTQELLEIEAFDGSHKFILNWAAPVKNDAGEITGAFVLNQDITDSVTSERALQESEERYRTYIDNSPEGIFIVDETGHYRDVNPSACSMLGYSREELLALSITDLVPVEIRSRNLLKFSELQESGSLTAELSLAKKNGEELPVIMDAVRLPDGRYMAFCMNITERKRAEKEIWAGHEILEGILNSIPVRVFWKDLNLVFLGCNAPFARDAGFEKPEDIIGKDDFAMGWRDQADLYRSDDRSVIASGLPKMFIEEPQKTPSGDIISLLTSKVPLRDAKGTIIGVLGTYIDITERMRAETALRQSEENYRFTLDATNDGFWDWNIPTGSVIFSPRWYTQIGYEPSEMPGTFATWQSLIHPDDQGMTEQKIRDHIRKKDEFYSVEFRMRTKQGDWKWIQARGKVVERDAEGNPIRMVGTHTDISERKQAEEALRQSEVRVKKKLEALTSPSGDITSLELADVIDTSAVQLLMNDFFSLTRIGIAIVDLNDNILVSTGWQDICTQFHRVHPETCKKCRESDTILSAETAPGTFRMYKCRNNMWDIVTPIMLEKTHIGNLFLGQFLFEDEPLDYELFRAQARQYGFDDANYLAALDRVPRFSRDTVELVMTFYTRFAGMISTLSQRNLHLARMVAERDHLLTSLVMSEARYRTLVENIPQKIFMKDRNSRYISVNEHFAHDLGIHSGEMVGKTDTDFFPPYLAAKYRSDDIRIMATGNTEEFEEKFIHKGKETWVHTIKTIVRDNDGNVSGVCGVFRDITERKRAEEALAAVNRKLTLLSGITRHDINNQLLTLNGFVGILQKKISDPSFHNDFSRIGQVSRQIAAMIKFTREYEQIGANAPVWQDCRTIVDNAEKQALLNGIMVKNDLSAGSEVFADPLIIKVFYNLIDNAVRHGGKVTTVRFSLENSKDDLVIVCEDDGEGMPADQKEQIFDRGFGKNTGLGLFLAREILSITGIGIRETGKPGKGARFEMTVPKGAWRFWKGVK